MGEFQFSRGGETQPKVENFPKNFFWGSSISAHQVEGNIHNDWTEWERQRANRQVEIAKKKAWPDFILKNYPNPLQEENYISGQACDHYHRFREDFDLAKTIGLNAYRFSIEWSRIEPEEGKFNEKEIAHYHEIIKALRERGIEPFVTLWHWTLPLWVAQQGGWESQKTIFHFSRFCERIAREFAGDVTFWMVLNEAGSWTADAYLFGERPPGKRNIIKTMTVYFHLIQAHKIVYTKLKEINPDFLVGIATSIEWWDPAFLRPFIHYFRNFFFRDRIRAHLDFIGVNYYQKKSIFGKYGNEMSDRGWVIYPYGLYRILISLWRRYQKPLFVTENGLADARDIKRAKFIEEHVAQIARALDDGVDVRGYFHWSLLDNFEWEKGFWPRFGLIEVDYKTQERKVRESAKTYTDIIQRHKKLCGE